MKSVSTLTIVEYICLKRSIIAKISHGITTYIHTSGTIDIRELYVRLLINLNTPSRNLAMHICFIMQILKFIFIFHRTDSADSIQKSEMDKVTLGSLILPESKFKSLVSFFNRNFTREATIQRQVYFRVHASRAKKMKH